MKEYFHAFLLGVLVWPVIILLLCGNLVPIVTFALHASLGPLIFYKVYCPRRGVTLDLNQKIWAGFWYYVGTVPIAFIAVKIILYLLYGN